MPVSSRSVVCAAAVLTAVLAVGGAAVLAVTPPQPASASPASQPPSDALAWALGTNLGLAAAIEELGTAPAIVKEKLTTSERIARALGTTVPALPERRNQDKAAFGAAILHYLVKDVSPISVHLTEKYSARHSLLFEMAIKSATIAIMYGPGDSTGLSVARVIEDRGTRTNLPPRLWKPLVDAIRGKEPYDAVKGKLLEMHSAVQKHLMAAA